MRKFWTGADVRQLRRASGSTQSGLANRLGIDVHTLRNWERRVGVVAPESWPTLNEIEQAWLSTEHGSRLSAAVARFLAHSLVKHDTPWTPTLSLRRFYVAYLTWAIESGPPPRAAEDEFEYVLATLGIRPVIGSDYGGLSLRNDPREPPGPPEPKPTSGPDYAPKNGKLASVAHVPSESEVEDQAKLHHRLRKKVEILKAALINVGNQYPELVRVADEYLSLLAPETAEIDVAGLWSVGGALSALLGAYKEQQAHQTLSAPLEPEAIAALTSLVRDHGAFILGFEEGRKLVERADEFALEPQLIKETEKSGRALMVELSTNEQLIDELTRRLHASINDAVQKAGWTASRHTYAAYATIRNFVRAVIKYSIGKEANIGAIMGILAGGSALAGDPNCEIIRAALPFLKQYSAQLLAFFNHSPEYRAYVGWAIGLLEEHAQSEERRESQPTLEA